MSSRSSAGRDDLLFVRVSVLNSAQPLTLYPQRYSGRAGARPDRADERELIPTGDGREAQSLPGMGGSSIPTRINDNYRLVWLANSLVSP
jgi:hypothetical protein